MVCELYLSKDVHIHTQSNLIRNVRELSLFGGQAGEQGYFVTCSGHSL